MAGPLSSSSTITMFLRTDHQVGFRTRVSEPFLTCRGAIRVEMLVHWLIKQSSSSGARRSRSLLLGSSGVPGNHDLSFLDGNE